MKKDGLYYKWHWGIFALNWMKLAKDQASLLDKEDTALPLLEILIWKVSWVRPRWRTLIWRQVSAADRWLLFALEWEEDTADKAPLDDCTWRPCYKQ